MKSHLGHPSLVLRTLEIISPRFKRNKDRGQYRGQDLDKVQVKLKNQDLDHLVRIQTD